MEIDQPEEVMEKLERFMQWPEGFLLLAGANGTGKTVCARFVYDESRLPRVDPSLEQRMFFTQSDLNSKWGGYMRRFGECHQFTKELKHAPLLVLDDLGTRRPTDGFNDWLFQIVDFRSQNSHRLGTVITTNLNADGMAEMFGSAVVSRVAADVVIRFDGEDRRRMQKYKQLRSQ